MSTKGPILIFDRSLTKKELAALLRISPRTLYRYLEEAGIVTDKKAMPPEKLLEIYEKLGWYKP